MPQTSKCRGVATKVTRYPDLGIIECRYYDTVVATLNPDRTVTLNSGGWRTATTKLRINQFCNENELGIRVYQFKGMWFVADLATGNVMDFYDGITV